MQKLNFISSVVKFSNMQKKQVIWEANVRQLIKSENINTAVTD